MIGSHTTQRVCATRLESLILSRLIDYKGSMILEGAYPQIRNVLMTNPNKTDPETQIKNIGQLFDMQNDGKKKIINQLNKDSLIKNLLYNERRQQDSVKLFEISDIYTKPNSKKRILGVIASGRVDKNYLDFSKKINNNYLNTIFNDSLIKDKLKTIDISRESVKSKLKNQIIYGEMMIDSSLKIDRDVSNKNNTIIKDYKYIPISEYPSSTRDISFSIKDFSKLKLLEEVIDSFRHELIKEIFIFDYFNNTKTKEIKIGYRFILQSKQTTITDSEVNEVMNNLISKALSIDSVSVPGLA